MSQLGSWEHVIMWSCRSSTCAQTASFEELLAATIIGLRFPVFKFLPFLKPPGHLRLASEAVTRAQTDNQSINPSEFKKFCRKPKTSAPNLFRIRPAWLKSYRDCRGWALRSQRSSRCVETPGTCCWRCERSWRWRGKCRWAACTPARARYSCPSRSLAWSRGGRNATGSTCKPTFCFNPACSLKLNQLRTVSHFYFPTLFEIVVLGS